MPKAKPKNEGVHIAIKKREMLNLSRLTPEQRNKIDRAVNPRDTPFSLRFAATDIDRWRAAAKGEGESITHWVEKQLNRAVGK